MKKNKGILIALLFVILLIGGVFILTNGKNKEDIVEGNNVSVVDGKQIITISAKGGYAPRKTTAKAGLPTVIKVITESTFDCSSALTIPSLGYRTNLPFSGETIIDISKQKAGTKLQGLCSMGMYNFSIDFN